MISEQDLLRSTETATQVQLLVNNDDLMKDMRALAKDDEEDGVVPSDNITVKFLANTGEPTVGQIDGIQGTSVRAGVNKKNWN